LLDQQSQRPTKENHHSAPLPHGTSHLQYHVPGLRLHNCHLERIRCLPEGRRIQNLRPEMINPSTNHLIHTQTIRSNTSHIFEYKPYFSILHHYLNHPYTTIFGFSQPYKSAPSANALSLSPIIKNY